MEKLCTSVRPQPLFWLRSDTETPNLPILLANTETTFQRENLVINIEIFCFSMGYHIYHKKPNLLPDFKYFCKLFLNILVYFQAYKNLSHSKNRKIYKKLVRFWGKNRY